MGVQYAQALRERRRLGARPPVRVFRAAGRQQTPPRRVQHGEPVSEVTQVEADADRDDEVHGTRRNEHRLDDEVDGVVVGRSHQIVGVCV